MVGCAILSFVAAPGCSAMEHVGRPPSADEIARINAQARETLPPMRLEYTNHEHACNAGPCSVGEPRPQPDEPPVDIQRILSANADALTVVTGSGETRHTRLSLIAAVNTPDHSNHVLRYTAGGAAVGLGVMAAYAGIVLLTEALLSQVHLPDMPAPSEGRSLTTGDVFQATWPTVAAGALVGLVMGTVAQHRRRYRLGDESISLRSDDSSP